MSDPTEKQQALEQFATFVNPQRVRVMRAAGPRHHRGRALGRRGCGMPTGARYLDCFTSAGSFNVGRRNPRVVAAAHAAVDQARQRQLPALLQSQGRAGGEARRDDARRPVLHDVRHAAAGEAIDFAIKLARGSTGRPQIVSTVNGYHGHTGFALSAGGRASFRAPVRAADAGVLQVPFGDLEALGAAVDERTAAVLLEPIQGEGGIVVPPPGYLAGVRAACDRAGALLILDEIQTGLGRTGRWWACEHDGVVPDIMTTAKSLGGSLVPISATVFTEDLREFLIPNPFIHLSTFGGSDLACAVALEVLAVIEETGLVEHAAAMGERLFAGLRRDRGGPPRGDHRGPRPRPDGRRPVRRGLVRAADVLPPGPPRRARDLQRQPAVGDAPDARAGGRGGGGRLPARGAGAARSPTCWRAPGPRRRASTRPRRRPARAARAAAG